MRRRWTLALGLCVMPQLLAAQATRRARPSPGVVDVHWHASYDSVGPPPPGYLAYLRGLPALLDSLGVRSAVVSGYAADLERLSTLAPGRILPALQFPCEPGTFWPRAEPRGCFPGGPERGAWPDTSWLRAEIRSGRVRVLGEILTQYLGIAPDDPRLEPYYALAEELDVPVAIHVGLGPPGAAYPSSPVGQMAKFRADVGRPLRLEPVLLRHPRLRLWVMHAGWPFGDEMLSLLYHHPQVHVDTGVLQLAVGRPEYMAYLKRLVDAGFVDRIMFGSDGPPDEVRAAIRAILAADFLTARQKRAVLHDNAARFLRLEPAAARK